MEYRNYNQISNIINILPKNNVQERFERKDKIISLFFPRRCPFCDDVTKYGSMVHDWCVEKIEYANMQSVCFKCGKPLDDDKEQYCVTCQRIKHYFDKGFALYKYRSAQDAIYRFKYQGRQEYADFFAKDIEANLGDYIRNLDIDYLVPVPMFPSKKIKRGYNQAEVLAHAIGRRMNIPVKEDIVYRTINTVPMKELSEFERRNNLKKAFNIGTNVVKLKKIIIIDDIYTTGSTMDNVALQLRKAGASHIFALSLAIGQGM